MYTKAVLEARGNKTKQRLEQFGELLTSAQTWRGEENVELAPEASRRWAEEEPNPTTEFHPNHRYNFDQKPVKIEEKVGWNPRPFAIFPGGHLYHTILQQV